MRAILLQMQNHPLTGAVEFFHPRKDLVHMKSINGHSYGLFKKKQCVLVEWMYYRPGPKAVPPEERLFIMQLRAKDFGTDPKPSGLRILKCLGFVEEIQKDENHGYGFLYELPQQVGNEFIPPMTLRQLLSPNGHLAIETPFLRRKFQLAYSLALFFEEFYYAGCLHENFNSNNVIFAQSTSASLSQPYVVGFQKSRPDGQAWSTDGPEDATKRQKYEQHPDYRKKGRFILEYDYYSLGVVLLEIGSWTSLDNWSKKIEYADIAPEDFRKDLRDKYVPRLAAIVGEVYTHAVRTCLDGTLERDRDSSPSEDLNRKVFHKFIEKVVKPLEGLSLLHI